MRAEQVEAVLQVTGHVCVWVMPTGTCWFISRCQGGAVELHWGGGIVLTLPLQSLAHMRAGQDVKRHEVQYARSRYRSRNPANEAVSW